MNDCFLKYKDKYKGKSCILFGTGTTLDMYQNRDDLIKIGSNEIIYKPYKMDFYFLGDPGSKKRGFLSDEKSYIDYKPNIDKFFRNHENDTHKGIVCECENASWYDVTRMKRAKIKFSPDIHSEIVGWASITYVMIQFAVYAGFKTIYLVGHDCNYKEGSFHDKGEALTNNAVIILKMWKLVKESVTDTKIFSINKIGLNLFNEKDYKHLEGQK